MEKHSYKIDIPVLVIFFVRPEPLSKVFEQIKLARPSKLYLYQDGPRENRLDDLENGKLCREIVADIDWDCQVFHFYQEKNFGCDPSEYISQRWMFDNEEYGIVLEDDDVPSQSFFPFCKEMLERYKDDERIGVICGMNNIGEVDSPYSYLFARTGSIWGWATWKKNFDQCDQYYTWLDDEYNLKLLKNLIGDSDYKKLIKNSQRHRSTGKEHYESILGSFVLLNSKMNIIPTKNLISNVGIGADGTHALDSLDKLPKGIRRVLFMKTHQLEFPLKHPRFVMEDVSYKKGLDRIMGNGYPLIKFYRVIESVFYRILRGDFQSIKKGVKRRLSNNT
ncbi:hypothetical protein [Pedobacter sp. Hv1]|uniref:hypothetical protein n=1 Tax=Pedobacter sp. Hv1 TaxID=1740090 RepID=UPI0006D8A3C5|nr:hypothetical protein [Pedobacter sp. Hv1]KQB99628.1 hypothetical protein AQF98_18940 [Pedobacter sp. Hv1]